MAGQVMRRTPKTREEWLKMRMCGIGGSEAAAVLGESPWMTPTELWRLKTGQIAEKSVSDEAAVHRGVAMEAPMRELFKALHPECAVEHHPFDMLYQPERPWLFATLDGEIVRTEQREQTAEDNFFDEAPESGESITRRGVLEIKNVSPRGKAAWAAWDDGKVPMHYFHQCCHQLLATGYDFVVLFAALYSANRDISIRERELWREDVQDELDWLLEKEAAFWRSVVDKAIPPLPLTM